MVDYNYDWIRIPEYPIFAVGLSKSVLFDNLDSVDALFYSRTTLTADIVLVILLAFRFTYTYPFQAGMLRLMYDELMAEFTVGVIFTLYAIGYRCSLLVSS